MNEDDLKLKEKQYREDLLYVYTESKNLFIRAEELLEDMKFFTAPVLEHRDALEHLTRYLNYTKDDIVDEKAIKELDAALGHELRAYFDIADYVCVVVRQRIIISLKHIPRRKISKYWDEYPDIRKKVFDISEKISEIRQNRTGSLDCLKKYQGAVNDMFEIYKEYLTKIEPKIKIRF